MPTMLKRILVADALVIAGIIGATGAAKAAPVLCDSINGWDACVDFSGSIHHVYIKDGNSNREANLFITCSPNNDGSTRWMLHSNSNGDLSQSEAREFTIGYCTEVKSTF